MHFRRIMFSLGLLAVVPVALAQEASTTTGQPGRRSSALQTVIEEQGIVYFDSFNNPGRINQVIGETRYPQWGDTVIADGQLCDELPQGDYFDTLPLPVYARDFYAEIEFTAFDALDTSVGFALGDFAEKGYDLLFLMNDFQGVWRVERWFFPMTPGLEQRSSQRSDMPLWEVGVQLRAGLEARDGVYTIYADRDGEMTPVFEDTFEPQGRQLALALWGSVSGPRRVCFDSVTVQPAR